MLSQLLDLLSQSYQEIPSVFDVQVIHWTVAVHILPKGGAITFAEYCLEV